MHEHELCERPFEIVVIDSYKKKNASELAMGQTKIFQFSSYIFFYFRVSDKFNVGDTVSLMWSNPVGMALFRRPIFQVAYPSLQKKCLFARYKHTYACFPFFSPLILFIFADGPVCDDDGDGADRMITVENWIGRVGTTIISRNGWAR